jgi:hypothetical protein
MTALTQQEVSSVGDAALDIQRDLMARSLELPR